MDAEKKTELLSGYFCVFRGNPIHCAPYAMFATIEQANKSINALGVIGPLTFKEWIEDYQLPESPDKPLWQS